MLFETDEKHRKSVLPPLQSLQFAVHDEKQKHFHRLKPALKGFYLIQGDARDISGNLTQDLLVTNAAEIENPQSHSRLLHIS